MTAAEIASLRLELGRCRQQADTALGSAMQLLDNLERDLRTRQRAAVPPKPTMLGYDLDHPLRIDDCEGCGFGWQSCACAAAQGAST